MSAEVDAYIAAAPKAAQPHLRKLREIIRSEVPEAEEQISYKMPFYRYHGQLLYFGAFNDHVGLYPAGYTDASHGLSEYAAGKGTYRFWLSEPLPVTAIRKFVRTRLKENKQRANK